MSEVIKIANCSGFYGDNLSIAKKMVEGGPIDVLTGDYLAELTMTILYNQKMKRGENLGYVGTCLLYTSPSPRDAMRSRIPASA